MTQHILNRNRNSSFKVYVRYYGTARLCSLAMLRFFSTRKYIPNFSVQWLIDLFKKKWINLTRSPDLRDTQISTWYRGKINGQGNWDHAWHKQHLFCKVSYIWRKYRHFDWLSVFSHNQTNSGEQPGTVIQCYNHLCFKLRDLQTRKMITHVLLVVLVICLIYFYRYVRFYSWFFFFISCIFLCTNLIHLSRCHKSAWRLWMKCSFTTVILW